MIAGVCQKHRREQCEELLQGARGTAGGEGEENVTWLLCQWVWEGIHVV